MARRYTWWSPFCAVTNARSEAVGVWTISKTHHERNMGRKFSSAAAAARLVNHASYQVGDAVVGARSNWLAMNYSIQGFVRAKSGKGFFWYLGALRREGRPSSC